MRTAKTLNWLIALAGAWEIVAPFILGYAFITAAVWDAVIVGIVLLVLGVWAALSDNAGTDRTLDWIAAIVGGWLIIAPFTLGYSVLSGIAVANAVIIGVIVLILGIWAAVENTRGYGYYGGGYNQYNQGYYGRGRDYYGPNYRGYNRNRYYGNREFDNRGYSGRGTDYGYDRDYGYDQGYNQEYNRGGNYGENQGFNRGFNNRDFNEQGPFYGVGPQGYQRSDQRIQDDVIDRLTFNGMVDATNIDVKVDNGVVTLDGSVPSRQDRRVAEDLADGVLGVRNVHNDLHVQHSQEHPSNTGLFNKG